MTLHQLKVFVTVAKLQSFTLAGEKLHISQPSLSSIVSALARELGAKLFERLGNKVHLTLAGQELFRQAEEIVAKAEGIKGNIDEIIGGKRGKIRIGGAAIAMASFLPLAIQKFTKEQPQIEVILKTDSGDNLEKKLLEGELDVAIIGRAPHSASLYREPYRDEEVVVMASPKHPLAKKRSVPLEEIVKEPWIVYTRGTTTRDLLEQEFSKKGLQFKPAVEVDVELGGRDAILNTVASGICIGILHKRHVLPDMKVGRVKVLRVPEINLKRTIHIVAHKGRMKSPAVQAFVECLRRYKQL